MSNDITALMATMKAAEAKDCSDMGWKVHEYVKLDRYQAAMLHGGNHTEQHLDMANSPVIPDGWQLVPKEPTEAMNKAGWAAINEHDEINPTYRAMLAAAPQQEVK